MDATYLPVTPTAAALQCKQVEEEGKKAGRKSNFKALIMKHNVVSLHRNVPAEEPVPHKFFPRALIMVPTGPETSADTGDRTGAVPDQFSGCSSVEDSAVIPGNKVYKILPCVVWGCFFLAPLLPGTRQAWKTRATFETEIKSQFNSKLKSELLLWG